MEFLTSLLLVLISILTFAHLLIHRSRSGKLVDKLPGPPHYPVIGGLLNVLVSPENLWNFFRNFAKELYPIYKIWVVHWPVVITHHADDAEILLSSQSHIEKSLFYEFLHPWLSTGLLTSTGAKWRMRRKMLTPAFHFNVLQQFTDVFIDNGEDMVSSLKNENRAVVKNLVPFLANYTLNAICETAMGNFRTDDSTFQEKYRQGVKLMGDLMYHRSVRPWLKNDWIFSLTREGKIQAESLKILHEFTNKIIKERKEYHEKTGGNYLKNLNPEYESASDTNLQIDDKMSSVKKKRLAMLDLLIAAQKENRVIDDAGIREEVDTFVFEGHDTTVMGMCFAVLLLAEHKEIQANARAEVDAIFKKCGGKLNISEMQHLSYLEQCIKESLRLFPPVPTVSRKLTTDIKLKNYTIPSGSIVNLHIFDLHRDPNFWPDPLVYDPDRFLPDKIKNRHPFSYIPFSGGPRNCIGQKFAMLELKTMLAYLLHNFYLEPVIECRKIQLLPDLVLKSAVPLDVKFIPI